MSARRAEGLKQLEEILEGTYPVAAKSAACGFISHNSDTLLVLADEEQKLDASMHAIVDPTISVEEIDLAPLYEVTAAAPAPTTNIDEGIWRTW